MDPMDNGHIDVVEMLDQLVDAKMNSIILAELDKIGDPYVKAVFILLNKYGISGSKAISFSQELDALSKIFNKKTDEGVGEI
jgi:hypothetical protein